MKVYKSLDAFHKLDFAVVTQGTFDGVHLGHKQILNRIIKLSQENKGESVVITFSPHPRFVLQTRDANLKLLHSDTEKIHHLSEAGIDNLLMVPFTEAFSQLTPQEFVAEILIGIIGMKIIVVGYDHRFGKDRQGSITDLKALSQKHHFEIEEINAHDIEQVAVSSTKIRQALVKGDIKLANSYLGHAYGLKGLVVTGRKKGRELGFPTANVQISDPNKLIPDEGVYAVTALIDNIIFQGMANLGAQPTYDITYRQLEVHLFGFNQNIYGKEIEVSFHHKVRDILKFDNEQALRNQLQNDMVMIKAILAEV
jgi:riboflavin kinase/FMN adenylyltransferase